MDSQDLWEIANAIQKQVVHADVRTDQCEIVRVYMTRSMIAVQQSPQGFLVHRTVFVQRNHIEPDPSDRYIFSTPEDTVAGVVDLIRRSALNEIAK